MADAHQDDASAEERCSEKGRRKMDRIEITLNEVRPDRAAEPRQPGHGDRLMKGSARASMPPADEEQHAGRGQPPAESGAVVRDQRNEARIDLRERVS